MAKSKRFIGKHINW